MNMDEVEINEEDLEFYPYDPSYKKKKKTSKILKLFKNAILLLFFFSVLYILIFGIIFSINYFTDYLDNSENEKNQNTILAVGSLFLLMCGIIISAILLCCCYCVRLFCNMVSTDFYGNSINSNNYQSSNNYYMTDCLSDVVECCLDGDCCDHFWRMSRAKAPPRRYHVNRAFNGKL